MKIEKYKKLKSNKYEVVIDDIKVKLYDDVIVKFQLLRKKELTIEEFEEITEYNDRLEAYYKSLRYITRKLRSEKEIWKLLDKDFSKEIIKETIERLKNDGYLNEELFLKSYINDQINFGTYGPNKVKDDLIKLGFSEEVANERVNNISDDIWLDKISKIINRRVSSNRTYGVYKLKEKIVYDLSRMGFYKWMIEDVLDGYTLSTDISVVRKEYMKLYNKLSKKLEGSDLDYQIRMKLFQKGFTTEEIEAIKKELL
jgi:regulatory protein